jgi:hypothetical protein
MATTIQVIVSCCNAADDVDLVDLFLGDRSFDATFHNLVDATAAAKKRMAKGVCVIIRPNYNEEDPKGKFFREWRSFNGEAFKECRWDIPRS